MTLRVHGIKACDTCRKARKWLDEQDIGYAWVDLRESRPTRDLLQHWLAALGAQRLVNRRSTTWRALPADARPDLDADAVPDLLADHPTLVKRPVFERGDEVRVGFDEAVREWLLRG